MKTNIDRRGVAAIEFAIVVPLLGMLILGVADLANATSTYWQLTCAAQAVGQIAANSAAESNDTNSLTKTQAYYAATAAYPVVPSFASATASNYGVVLTSVYFTPTVATCTSGCTYTATVAWSHTLLGGVAPRSCGTLASVSNNSPPSSTTLPASAFSAAPLLVVDVYYTFYPLRTTYLPVSISMMRSGYFPMRTGTTAQWMAYSDPTSTQPTCPGISG